MDHRDHVRLLRDGVLEARTTWADLGSGEGAFTLALADLLGPGGTIVSVDRDARALGVQQRALRDTFPDVRVTLLVADFARPRELPPLDGVVMANSLHFERDKVAVLGLVRSYLRPGGRLILVEYDSDRGNQWVPYPLSFHSWVTLAAEAGFSRHAAARVGAESVPWVDLLGAQHPLIGFDRGARARLGGDAPPSLARSGLVERLRRRCPPASRVGAG